MPLQYASQVSHLTVVSLFNGWLSRKTYWWKEGRRLLQHAAHINHVTVVSSSGFFNFIFYIYYINFTSSNAGLSPVLVEKKQKAEDLLYNMLPRSVT